MTFKQFTNLHYSFGYRYNLFHVRVDHSMQRLGMLLKQAKIKFRSMNILTMSAFAISVSLITLLAFTRKVTFQKLFALPRCKPPSCMSSSCRQTAIVSMDPSFATPASLLSSSANSFTAFSHVVFGTFSVDKVSAEASHERNKSWKISTASVTLNRSFRIIVQHSSCKSCSRRFVLTHCADSSPIAPLRIWFSLSSAVSGRSSD